MNKKTILKAAQSYESRLSKIISDSPYEERGIFNSELLFIISVVETLGINNIVESGRARGHSTYILSKYFKNNPKTTITSIDYDRFSQDSHYSEKRLSTQSNVVLKYGDSRTLIPGIINNDSAVLIDGPKGDDAIALTLELLKDKRVKVVFIHDVHKNCFERNIIECLFTTNVFFSDDKDFVDRFKYLDDQCWKLLSGKGEAPYQRKGKPIKSYASTACAVLNSDPTEESNTVKNNFLQYYHSKKGSIKKQLLKTPLGMIFKKNFDNVFKKFGKN